MASSQEYWCLLLYRWLLGIPHNKYYSQFLNFQGPIQKSLFCAYKLRYIPLFALHKLQSIRSYFQVLHSSVVDYCAKGKIRDYCYSSTYSYAICQHFIFEDPLFCQYVYLAPNKATNCKRTHLYLGNQFFLIAKSICFFTSNILFKITIVF